MHRTRERSGDERRTCADEDPVLVVVAPGPVAVVRDRRGRRERVRELVALVAADREQVRRSGRERAVRRLGAGDDAVDDRLSVGGIGQLQQPVGDLGGHGARPGAVEHAVGQRAAPLVDVDPLLGHLRRERLGGRPVEPAVDAALRLEQEAAREEAARGGLDRAGDDARAGDAADRRQPKVPPLGQEQVHVDGLLPRAGPVVGDDEDVAVAPRPRDEVRRSPGRARRSTPRRVRASTRPQGARTTPSSPRGTGSGCAATGRCPRTPRTRSRRPGAPAGRRGPPAGSIGCA